MRRCFFTGPWTDQETQAVAEVIDTLGPNAERNPWYAHKIVQSSILLYVAWRATWWESSILTASSVSGLADQIAAYHS